MGRAKQVVPLEHKDTGRTSRLWGVARSNALSTESTTSASRSSGQILTEKWNSVLELAEKTKITDLKTLVTKLLDSAVVMAVMMIATFWTLFANDARIASEASMDADQPFMVITSISFFLFLLEIVLSLYAKDKYYRSPYFLFDVMATVTLITEMSWVMEIGGDLDNTTALDAARTARTVKILRVVRLVRLVRIVKLYRYVMDHFQRRAEKATQATATASPSWEDNPSAVGRALQEAITLQVIVGVLVMLVVFPYLSVQEIRIRLDYEAEVVREIEALLRRGLEEGSSSAIAASRAMIVNSHTSLGLAYFQLYDSTVIFANETRTPPMIRTTEYQLVAGGSACEGTQGCSFGGFDIRDDLVLQARFSIGLITFVMVLLCLGVIVFNRISMIYCIAPIEKLFTIVNNFARDPMRKLETFEDDTLDELNELERSIRKIASLLQVGIGLAGRETIARVLRTTGDINPIAVGRKVNCLFGFCDIRQFTDATECLQEEVMLFTNSIGHIVHHAVHDNGGFANKNIGDAFLVVWTGGALERRIAQADRPAGGGEGCVKWSPTVGDGALAALIRLTICVRGAPHITALAQNEVLQRRIPGYTVRLGCGLHVGWAIEGALGSQKKIDATYLSPATNIAMGLEGATKAYGNLLLLSEQTYHLLSPTVQARVRKIDRVFITAGSLPFDLYTYDLQLGLSVHPDETKQKAMIEHVFQYPLGITPQFREDFAQGLRSYLIVRCGPGRIPLTCGADAVGPLLCPPCSRGSGRRLEKPSERPSTTLPWQQRRTLP